jgi:hypothetical protein
LLSYLGVSREQKEEDENCLLKKLTQKFYDKAAKIAIFSERREKFSQCKEGLQQYQLKSTIKRFNEKLLITCHSLCDAGDQKNVGMPI